jgi:DegV family protein with EDD domain
MPDIALVTDSTAYLTAEEVKQTHVTVVPLSVNFDEGYILDGLVDGHEFFARVDRSKRMPFTSQPAVGQFVDAYQPLLEQGKEIISIHISGKLSGTIESAGGAARMLNTDKVSLVDSEQTATPLAYLVMAAAQWAAAGLSRLEIVSRLETEKKRMRTYLVPDTLEYLKKGGRIGGAAALLGTLLKIKPVLHLHQGRVEALDKVRTRSKAIARILQELPPANAKVKVSVVHSIAPEDAEKVKELIHKQLPLAQVDVRELGPVISIHTGPRFLGVSYWPQT